MMPLRIRAADTDWHSRFFRFVATCFPGLGEAGWHAWRDRGGWTGSYEIFALVQDGEIASTIGRTYMQLAINGRLEAGHQLGAVATLPAFRGQGLARRLMDQVIADAPDLRILLFANAGVLDFYPRFGFRRIPQHRATLRTAITPEAPAPRCDPASPADRARLAALCARAAPIGGALAMRDYYPVLLWHLTCGGVDGYWLPGHDAFCAATTGAGRLTLHDVIAPAPIPLAPFAAHLATAPASQVEFGFDPRDWWPATETAEIDDTNSRLFLRGAPTLSGPVLVSALAHT